MDYNITVHDILQKLTEQGKITIYEVITLKRISSTDEELQKNLNKLLEDKIN